MEERHTFKIEIQCSINFFLDFEGCVAAVRKHVFVPVLTAVRRVRSDAPGFFRRSFSNPNLRWAAGKLKPVVIVVVVMMFHKLVTFVDNYLRLELSPEIMQSIWDVLAHYFLSWVFSSN